MSNDSIDFEVGDWLKGRSIELSGQFGKVEAIVGAGTRAVRYVVRLTNGEVHEDCLKTHFWLATDKEKDELNSSEPVEDSDSSDTHSDDSFGDSDVEIRLQDEENENLE